MPNEIYHRSNWGNPNPEGWGDIYFDPAATNKLYNHSDYYENSDGTDKILRDIPNKARWLYKYCYTALSSLTTRISY